MTITQSRVREIIQDFADEIKRRKTCTPKPSKTVIDFRSEKRDGFERPIVSVPIDLLRFRKENGRIASGVLSYERSTGTLRETDKDAQEILGKFLEDKDIDKTAELKNLIFAVGQDAPAIITCDGFLIDGNRRKLVLGMLRDDHPHIPDFHTMKVVILPGENDEGGPPTLLEIEKIENRYQLQSDGKAEYYGFDAALSTRQKESRGFSLEEQLRDDPQYAHLEPKEFNKIVEKARRDLLHPLECIDRYLNQINRPGLYKYISTGLGDKQGRWQAFIDYSHVYSKALKNDRNRQKIGLAEEEVGDIEDAAFKIIRLRDLAGIAKAHDVIRKLPKYCTHAKKEILAISNKVPDNIPEEETYDQNGDKVSLEIQDKKWAAMAQQDIIYHLKRSMDLSTQQVEKATPITLLTDALKKLNHDQMDTSVLGSSDWDKARKLAADIQKRANEIEHEIYSISKKLKKLLSN